MRSYTIVAMAATAAALVPPSAPRRPLTPMQGFFDAFKNESFDSAPKGGLSNAPAAKKTVPVTIGSRTVQALPNQRLKDVVRLSAGQDDPLHGRVAELAAALMAAAGVDASRYDF